MSDDIDPALMVTWYEEAWEGHLEHVHDLDVAMNGDGAATRPLLIDIKDELMKRIEFWKEHHPEPQEWDNRERW